MRDKLKACPFCGGEAEIGEGKKGQAGCFDPIFAAGCTSCGCRIDDWFDGEAEAIAAWNTRVDDSETRPDDHQTDLPSAGDTQAPTREQQLEQALKVAREALVRFADFAAYLESETEGFSDDDEFDLEFNGHLFTNFYVSHFRHAHQALKGTGADHG